MEIIRMRLTAEEPLAITDGSSEGMGHRALPFIPGSMLLGALAMRWRALHPEVADPDSCAAFCGLFITGAVEWGNAYPMAGANATVPIPLCYQKVKNFPGLPSTATPKEDLGKARVFNTLALEGDDSLMQLCREEWGMGGDEFTKPKKLEPGFMDPKHLVRPEIPMSWSMHVALSERRAAADGQLFGYSSICPGVSFCTEICCHDESLLQDLRQLLGSTPSLRVGHSRSAGYGKVSVGPLSSAPATAQAIGGKAPTLFLLSDYIPSHSWLSPLKGLREDLAAALGANPDDLVIKPKKCSIAYSEIQGFNGLWRLPRRSRKALQKGSVLTFEASPALKGTLPCSMGACKAEGYGRILANPSFLSDRAAHPTALPESPHAGGEARPKVASALLPLVRRRASARLAHDMAVRLCATKPITDLVDSICKKQRPSSSQRGNIRGMVGSSGSDSGWLQSFQLILEKTPGKQWKNAEGQNPLGSPPYENLDVIMSTLLGADGFRTLSCKLLPELQQPQVIGGKLEGAELPDFWQALHRNFILEFIKDWDRASFKSQGSKTKEARQ